MAEAFKACSVNGCKRNAHHAARGRRGWCCAHYKRWLRHGDPQAGIVMVGEHESFIDEALSAETDVCIDWPFYVNPKGYGKVWRDGVRDYAHRFVCRKTHGNPPTQHHQAAHSCGNASCVNPKHIRWATPQQNEADKVAHGTLRRGTSCKGAKLTESDVRKIRNLRGAATAHDIGEKFGVSAASVCLIQARKNWAWLD